MTNERADSGDHLPCGVVGGGDRIREEAPKMSCVSCAHFVSTGNGEGYCTVDGRRLGGLFADPKETSCEWYEGSK